METTMTRETHVMARNTVRTFLGLALLLAAGGCDQPAPKCTAAHAPYAATYTLVSGDGDCAQLKGEILNVWAYNGAGKRNTIDYSKISLAIQPQSMSDLALSGREPSDPDTEDQPYGFGAYQNDEPGGDDYCVVPTLSAANISLAEVPEVADMCPITPAEPAVEVRYEFSNVRVYTTAKAIGTKLFADLTYTKDGCTATYRVAAISPAVSCAVPPAEEPPAEEPPAEEDASIEGDGGEPLELDGGEPPVDEGDAGCPAEEEEPSPEPAPEVVLDEALCSPNEDPAAGRATGSGINPDFKVRCDPDLTLCVLNEEAPPAR